MVLTVKNIIRCLCCTALVVAPYLSHAQDLRKLNKKSYYTYVYEVPADSVLRMHSDAKYNYGHGLSNFKLIDSFVTADGYKKALPLGHYLMVDVNDRVVYYTYKLQSNISAHIFPGYKDNRLIIRDYDGHDITDAHVIFRKLRRWYRPRLWAYRLPFSNEDGRVLTIKAKGETVFYDYTTDDKDEDTRTKPGPKKERPHKDEQEDKKRNKRSRISEDEKTDEKLNGYTVFNKPKYLPHDTVKCKAFLLHDGHKAYTEPLRLYAVYGYYGKKDTIALTDSLMPVRPGAYDFQFVLSDSFQMDRDYQVVFMERKSGKVLCSGGFYTEDYLLDKYRYSFTLDKNGYYEEVSDTIRMTATCKDQVGMNAMDARVRITATTSDAEEWYADDECVPDTLFVIEKKLSATGDTKLNYPVEWLPDAKIFMTLHADFVNAASEHQERSRTVTVNRGRHGLVVYEGHDTIYADYYVKGKTAKARGHLEVNYYNDDEPRVSRAISYPFWTIADNMADDYRFKAYDGDTLKATHSMDQDRAYLLWGRTDSSIVLYPGQHYRYMRYTLFYMDGKIFREGAISNKKVVIVDHSNDQYRTLTQYIRKGDVESEEGIIAPIKLKLHVAMQQSAEVYPGRKDTVTVKVSTSKGRPVPNADVTALSYTSQFGRGLNLPGLYHRYGHNYDDAGLRESDLGPLDDADASQHLDKDTFWLHRAHLDTMLYYRLVYPHQKIIQQLTPIATAMPQFAPFVFDHGKAVPIHMIYVDDVLEYYDGTGPYTPYSIIVGNGKSKIGLRTTSRLIHLDNIEFKEGFKTELIMELDSVSSLRDTMPAEMTDAEKRLMQRLFIFYKVQFAKDTAWFWQGNSDLVFAISPNQYYNTPAQRFVPIGPLGYGKINFYIPHDYSLAFEKENGYAYSFSHDLTRLELHDSFSAKHIKFTDSKGNEAVRFGEIQNPHPEIDLSWGHRPDESSRNRMPWQPAMFKATDMSAYYRRIGSGYSQFDLNVISDSVIDYVRIYRTDDMSFDQIYNYSSEQTYSYNNEHKHKQDGIAPGVYDIVAFNPSGYSYTRHGVVLEPNSVCRVTVRTGAFKPPFSEPRPDDSKKIGFYALKGMVVFYIPTSYGQELAGRVTNEKGDGISYASVILLDSFSKPLGRYTISDRNGYYTLPGLPPGVYGLEFRDAVHVSQVSTKIPVRKGQTAILSVTLRDDHSHDKDHEHEVTVTGYNRPMISAASTSVSMNVVQGEALGVSNIENAASMTAGVTQQDASGSIEPQYIVNGHKMKSNGDKELNLVLVSAKKEASFFPEMNEKNGSDNGLAEKYSDASKLRTGFSDYAYWQPDLITDHKGEAKFIFKYPDNITSWASYAIAMNRRHQMGVGSTFTRSFKDCIAELAIPQFLIPGDSSVAAVKITDYLHKPIHLKTNFVWNGKKTAENDVEVTDVLTDEVPIVAATDEQGKELKASFNISNAEGFGDGEERSIPIVQRGTDETHGSFALLRGDTSLSVALDTSDGPVTIYAQSDLLEVLEDEAQHVRKYPYWCMEQTSSRLIMITILEKVYATLGKPSDLQKEKEACITKLQKGQLYSGAYGWWEYSPASVRLTTYVLTALAKAGIKDAPNITAGYTYLNAALPLMTRADKLSTLELYAETGHHSAEVMEGLHKMPFDSLTLHQQLQYIKAAMLVSGKDDDRHWQSVMKQKQRSIFGSSYWGDDSWYWHSNQVSTTVTVYEIAGLKKDHALQEEIIQYFLEMRTHHGWRNTAESAMIASAILPRVLADRGAHPQPPSLTISGIGEIKTFPFQTKLQPGASSLSISKKGFAPVYFTAYQTVFNPAPKAVNKDFDVSTNFEKSNETVAALSAGESAELVVHITTHKACEYLMIEVPIPAGCTYGDKEQGYGYSEVHREYFKDKVVIFCEDFSEGRQEFRIPIEARYRGSYTVNPARVQLMYFPTFFGRDDIKRVAVK